jgi:ribosomal protein L18
VNATVLAPAPRPLEILARAEKRLRGMVARGSDHTTVAAVFRTYEAIYLQATAPVVDDTMALVEAVS